MINRLTCFNAFFVGCREGESDGLKEERDEIKNHFDEKKNKYVWRFNKLTLDSDVYSK